MRTSSIARADGESGLCRSPVKSLSGFKDALSLSLLWKTVTGSKEPFLTMRPCLAAFVIHNRDRLLELLVSVTNKSLSHMPTLIFGIPRLQITLRTTIAGRAKRR